MISSVRKRHRRGSASINRGSIDERGWEELLRSDERFELLVRSVKDYALFMLDPEGRVVSWNEGAERIKGYTANEILGKSFNTFYPKEAIKSGFPQFELEVASREGRFEDEGWRVRKDGSLFWANVIITAMRNPDGQLVGFAKVTRDLTVRREAEEQARRLAAEQAAHVEAARRGEELAHLNDRLRQQAVELQVALAATKAARDNSERAAAAATEAYRGARSVRLCRFARPEGAAARDREPGPMAPGRYWGAAQG